MSNTIELISRLGIIIKCEFIKQHGSEYLKTRSENHNNDNIWSTDWNAAWIGSICLQRHLRCIRSLWIYEDGKCIIRHGGSVIVFKGHIGDPDIISKTVPILGEVKLCQKICIKLSTSDGEN